MPPTSIVSESLPESSPSDAVSVSTYVPVAEKLTLVAADAALPNVTIPGPLVLVQSVVTGTAVMPSSVNEPLRLPGAGSVTGTEGPALTTGGALSVPATGPPL